VMAAPSYVKGNSEGEFVFDWGWADLADRMGLSYYPKIVVAVPFTPASGARVLVAPDEDRTRAIGIMAGAAPPPWPTRGVAGAPPPVVQKGGRVGRPRALSTCGGSRCLGGERLSAPRGLPVSLASRRGHHVRRVPRALQLQATKPDQARGAEHRERGHRRA